VSGPVFPAAKKGDRISHNARSNQRSSNAIVAAVLGQSLTVRGAGGAISTQVGAATSCSGPRATLSLTELLPGTTSGTIEGASPTVFVAPGVGAALAEADPVDCSHHSDKPIAPGTTTVLVQGLGLARSGGETGCGAILCDGAPTVFAGGPASSGAGSGTRSASSGAPNGTSAASPIADAVARAHSLATHVGAALASVTRGAALIETTLTETPSRVSGATSGALSAIAGAFTGTARGGTLGALTGSAVTSA